MLTRHALKRVHDDSLQISEHLYFDEHETYLKTVSSQSMPPSTPINPKPNVSGLAKYASWCLIYAY